MSICESHYQSIKLLTIRVPDFLQLVVAQDVNVIVSPRTAWRVLNHPERLMAKLLDANVHLELHHLACNHHRLSFFVQMKKFQTASERSAFILQFTLGHPRKAQNRVRWFDLKMLTANEPPNHIFHQVLLLQQALQEPAPARTDPVKNGRQKRKPVAQKPTNWLELNVKHLKFIETSLEALTTDFVRAVKADVDYKCWRLGCFGFISKYRAVVEGSSDAAVKRALSQFVDAAVKMYTNAYTVNLASRYKIDAFPASGEQLKSRTFSRAYYLLQVGCRCIGDMLRAKLMFGEIEVAEPQQIVDRCQGFNCDAQSIVADMWLECITWYRRALAIQPHDSHSLHQLGRIYDTVSKLDTKFTLVKLQSICYYHRSLACTQPHDESHECILDWFAELDAQPRDVLLKIDRVYCKVDTQFEWLDSAFVEQSFLVIHKLIVTKTDLDLIDVDGWIRLYTVAIGREQSRMPPHFRYYAMLVNLMAVGKHDGSHLAPAIELAYDMLFAFAGKLLENVVNINLVAPGVVTYMSWLIVNTGFVRQLLKEVPAVLTSLQYRLLSCLNTLSRIKIRNLRQQPSTSDVSEYAYVPLLPEDLCSSGVDLIADVYRGRHYHPYKAIVIPCEEEDDDDDDDVAPVTAAVDKIKFDEDGVELSPEQLRLKAFDKIAYADEHLRAQPLHKVHPQIEMLIGVILGQHPQLVQQNELLKPWAEKLHQHEQIVASQHDSKIKRKNSQLNNIRKMQAARENMQKQHQRTNINKRY